MSKASEYIASIEAHGMHARGKKEWIRHLSGGKLSPLRAIRSKCYDCCGMYADGKNDCGIPECGLYPFMPFAPKKPKVASTMSAEQRAVFRERMRKGAKATP